MSFIRKLVLAKSGFALALATLIYLAVLLSSPSFAQTARTPPPEPGSGTIVVCYYKAAIEIGLSKCDPPSTLIGAVYGRCSDIEDAIRQDAMRETSPGGNPQNVADIAIRYVHEHMSSQIQGWLLDAQVFGNPSCKAPESPLK